MYYLHFADVSETETLRGKNRRSYDLKPGDRVHGFELLSVDAVPKFALTVYTLQHSVAGTRHLHLDCADTENVYAVLFRTPPDDNTGKPHVLEHFALCGSERFPVRDPFMNMLKRSLNTYMNAWTGSDFTMYPYAT